MAGLGTLSVARDNALLRLGFVGAMRRSELVGIEVEHVDWMPDDIEIMRPRSNTAPLGEGIIKVILYGGGPCCPAKALRTWLDAADIGAGPVFRRISKWGAMVSTPLGVDSGNAILEDCESLAWLDCVPDRSSQSLRCGMATSAYRAAFRDIKMRGGWCHGGVVQGYEAGRFDGRPPTVRCARVNAT